MSESFVPHLPGPRPGHRLGSVLLLWILAVLLVCFPDSANAQQCRIESVDIWFNQMRVAPDTPIGATISDARVAPVTFHCPSSGGTNGVGFRIQAVPSHGPSATVGDAWNTGVPGIGVRISGLLLDRVISTPPSPDGQDIFPTIWGRVRFTGVALLRYQLVKTGNISSTANWIDFGIVNTFRNRTTTTNYVSPTLATASIQSGNISLGTCRVTTPYVNAPLAAVPDTALETVGATAGATPFRIGLHCENYAHAHITLTDATTPGNRSDLLTLTADSTARGVQLRIRRPSNEAVRFGPDSGASGNTNQWMAGVVSGAGIIQMQAEYVAVGPVTPGTVRGIATFTMSYQ